MFEFHVMFLSVSTFEPVASKMEPAWDVRVLSILVTCSPDISRYKEFCKNGGIRNYMPSS